MRSLLTGALRGLRCAYTLTGEITSNQGPVCKAETSWVVGLVKDSGTYKDASNGSPLQPWSLFQRMYSSGMAQNSSQTATVSTTPLAGPLSPEASPLSPEGTSAANPPGSSLIPGKSPSAHGAGRAGAKLRKIEMSEKKINYFAKLIRRMHVEDALAQCALQPKKAGKIIGKVIKSAMANAENNHGLDPRRLMIDIIEVGRGTKRKRMWPRARGRADVRELSQSHMEIILKETDRRPKMQFKKPILERRRKHTDGIYQSGGGLRRPPKPDAEFALNW